MGVPTSIKHFTHNVGTQSTTTFIPLSGTLGHRCPTNSLVISITVGQPCVSGWHYRLCLQHTAVMWCINLSARTICKLFIYLFAQAHTLRTIRQGLEQDSKAQTCTDSYPKITDNPTQYNYQVKSITNYKLVASHILWKVNISNCSFKGC